MHDLTIYRLFFTESDCYRKGVRIKPCGVQVHSTGANNPYLRRYVGPDDGRLGPNPNGNTHNRPGGMRGAVRLSGSAGKITLADQAFVVQPKLDGETVTDEFIPDLDDLLASVSRLEQANDLAMVLLATNRISTVSDGVVTPVSAGTATIYAEAEDGTREYWYFTV